MRIMLSVVLAAGLISSANAEYWRDSDGVVVTNNYGECVVDSQGTYNEPDEALLLCGDAEIKTNVDETRIHIPAAVLFDFDSSIVDENYELGLDAVFADVPANATVAVLGYTDLVGPAEYNKDLGMRRALAVGDILPVQDIIAESYGETMPLVDTEAAERQNRRVEILAIWETETQTVIRHDR